MKGKLFSLAGLLLAGVFALPSCAVAERLLRVTESTLGEADPQKPADLPGSMLMINLYDYLVTAQPGGAVAPSLATHPFLAKVTSEELLAELAGREAFGRAAEPWEVATVIVFLASDYASYLTGEVISVSSQHP